MDPYKRAAGMSNDNLGDILQNSNLTMMLNAPQENRPLSSVTNPEGEGGRTGNDSSGEKKKAPPPPTY